MGKPEYKRPLGKSRGGWEDDKEMRLESLDWVYLARDRDKCRGE
jgi:hypothetical protein